MALVVEDDVLQRASVAIFSKNQIWMSSSAKVPKQLS